MRVDGREAGEFDADGAAGGGEVEPPPAVPLGSCRRVARLAVQVQGRREPVAAAIVIA